MENLNLRMYFFVPYNISEIQKGIQAGHAALEYARLFGDTEIFQDFVYDHKTWIILNGGTTNENQERLGSLQDIVNSIDTFNNNYDHNETINYSVFKEPDLNDTLTAICFICDERVWDFKTYPDLNEEELYDGTKTIEEIAEENHEWEKMIGNKSNIFLRNLIKGMRLA